MRKTEEKTQWVKIAFETGRMSALLGYLEDIFHRILRLQFENFHYLA